MALTSRVGLLFSGPSTSFGRIAKIHPISRKGVAPGATRAAWRKPAASGAISWMDVAPRPNELVQSHYRAPVFPHTGEHENKRGVPGREDRSGR
jgi:hypothetical protein